MEKRESSLEEEIDFIHERFLEKTKEKEILIISHFDTDGISSAAIMIQTLKALDKKFSVKIVKSLEEEFISNLPREKIILFLDLGSNILNYLKKTNLEDVFIIDHHEINQEIPKGVYILNSELCSNQKISASCLTYLFCKRISPENKKLAKLAILGMIGDTLEKEIDKVNNGILEEGEIKRKRGLLIYPSTRPLNKVLEYSSYPYIPEVTGNSQGVLDLLREINIQADNGKCKSLMELNEEEMERLITSIMLRNPKVKTKEIVGDIFLIKFFNKLEDARELSAKINACSRYGESGTALLLCMEISRAKKRADTIHVKHRQNILSALKFVSKTEKISGRGFVIINAKDQIQDTIIGTIASILSNSAVYEEGTIITTLARYEQKIKVSSRTVGKNGRNVRNILSRVVELVGGEVGGHEFAAGCLISLEKEQEFIDILKKNLEVEVIKI
ncbi:MAG: DHH family phosphoesterase [archaeon]